MLIVFALAAFGIIWAIVFDLEERSIHGRMAWREAFLKAAILWSTLALLIGEGLGVLGLLRMPAIGITWGILVGLLSVVAIRQRAFGKLTSELLRFVPRPRPREVILFGGTLGLVITLLLVAWVAPSNNVDSLLYHMSRVMHWVQNGSLEHYAASYHHQLFMPPWSEIAILNLRELWGSDAPANLVQWFSMVGSLIGVAAIAGNLGVGRNGQLLATIFAATVPMGILQATSTQNDYVTAFWLICVGYLVTKGLRQPLSAGEIVLLGLAFGLGILTKATFFVYGAPFGIAYLLGAARRSGLRRAAAQALTLVALMCSLNFLFWSRNLETYGGPYGDPEWSLGMLTPNSLARILLRESGESAGGVNQALERVPISAALVWPLSRLGQTAALNLVTPSAMANHVVWGALDSIPALFDSVVSHTLTNAAWSHEDSAGSPLHLMLVIASAVPALATPAWRRYLVIVSAGFILLALVVQGATFGFGVRFQLPFFVASAPMFGLAVDTRGFRRWQLPIGVLMLISSLPYVLFNNTRPVVGAPPWPTRTRSVFVGSEAEIMFAVNPELRGPTEELAAAIRRSGCTQVGLRLDSSYPEYQLWWILDAPQSGVRLEPLTTLPSLRHLLDPNFKPCAVICTNCGGRAYSDRLPLYSDFSGLGLYLESNPSTLVESGLVSASARPASEAVGP